MDKGVAHQACGRQAFLSPADGKGGHGVSSITEDADERCWSAGHESTGLARHDGTSFQHHWAEETRVSTDRRE